VRVVYCDKDDPFWGTKLIGKNRVSLRTADFEEAVSVREWLMSTRSGKPPKREGRPNDLTGTTRRAVELGIGAKLSGEEMVA